MILKKMYNTLETKLTALFPSAFITMFENVEGQKDNRFEIQLKHITSHRVAEITNHELIISMRYIDARKNHLQKTEVFEQVVEGFVNGINLEDEQLIPKEFEFESNENETKIQFTLLVSYERDETYVAPLMTALKLKEE